MASAVLEPVLEPATAVVKSAEELLALSVEIDRREPSGLYFFFSEGQLVYVGQSGFVHERIHQHLSAGAKTFDRVAVVHLPKEQLNDLEAEYIVRHKPAYNHYLPTNSLYKGSEFIKKLFGVTKFELNRLERTGLIDVHHICGRAYYMPEQVRAALEVEHV